ncbi:MAG: hypothetical protein WKG01_20665 [Kofleriaceae bacterium]
MITRCPICELEVPPQPICRCGYDAETRDLVEPTRRAREAIEAAKHRWNLALWLFGLSPLWVFLLLSSLPLLGAAIGIQAGVGLVIAVLAMIDSARAHDRLIAAREIAQLPAARIVE